MVIIEFRLGERDRCTAKSALGADPANEPMRAAAARTMVLDIGAIDDVMPALRETGRKGRCCSIVDENSRHSPRSTSPKGPQGQSWMTELEK